VRAIAPAIEVPICAVCNKPVERFEWEYSFEEDTRTYRAYCHGQKQQVKLNALQLIKSDIKIDRVFEGLPE